MIITPEKAIEIVELVANNSYVAEVSDADGNNREIVAGNGSDMAEAIEGGPYSEYSLTRADEEAVAAYETALKGNLR